MMAENRHSYRFIISCQYFIYFAVLGIFLPYFNLYCYHLGFSGVQIGVLSALRSIVLVLFALMWSILADRLHLRRPIYILCNFISSLIWLLFFFTTRFGPMLVITLFYGVFYAPVISFLEAFTMDVLGAEKQSYGRLRAWGSLGFIGMVLVVGKLIALYSLGVILGLIAAGSWLLAAISVRIPSIQASKRQRFAAGAGAFLSRRAMVFFVSAFLMLVSHGAYYGFFSIHLEDLGYGSAFIGLAWALASTAEILVMIQSERIFNRFALENVLMLSFAAAVLRWLVLYFTSSAALIMASQLLHAVTYGTFHMASILYIDRLSPRQAKTLGQAVNNAVTYGLGLMAGFFFTGWLYEKTGSFALFLVSAGIAVAGGGLFWGNRMLERSRAV